MKEGKKYLLIFILFFIIILNSAPSFSLDSEIVITGGGDSEGIVDYLGDEELFFMGAANTAPVILSAILNSTYGTNKTTENLSVYFSGVSDDDGDAVTNITDWRVDGNSIAVLNMPFDSNIYSNETGGIRDYSTYENNGTLGGGNSANSPTWTSSGKIGGAYDFDGVDDYVEVPSSPSLTNFTAISVECWFTAKTLGDGSYWRHIVDKGWMTEGAWLLHTDKATKQLRWVLYLDGGQRGVQTNSNLTENTWYHAVGTYDGTKVKLYLNGIKQTQETTYSKDSFSNSANLRIAQSTHDHHGLIDEVRIYNRALSPEQIYQMYLDGVAGHNVEMIVSNETTKSETWQVAVTPNDATGDGETVFSNNLTIENSLPTVTLVSPEDGNVTTNRTPTFVWIGYDADGDELTYEFNITLIPLSLCTDPDRGAIGISDENYTMPFYLNCLYDNGDYYEWSVRASDDGGSIYGEWSETRKIYINSDIAISLPVDVVNFGSMVTGTNDTTDDAPEPFLLKNDGNCFVNVTINATNLWTSVSNPSDYFKYKIDNKSGEEGAFNWLQSKINWTQVPSDDEMSIAKLNWSDAKDVAEIDLNISVPSQEGAGDKSSTVYFTASLGE